MKALSLRRRAAPTGGPSRGSRPRRFPASGIPLLRDPMKNEKKVSICQGKLCKSTPVGQMKVAQRAGTHIVPALRSNWLPFYRPYSFASQPFDCFAENIQFSRSCIAVQPPFARLPDYFFILSCLSSFVKILRPVFSVFCRSFSCRSASFAQRASGPTFLMCSIAKKGNFWKLPVFHAENTPTHAESLAFYPPRAIFSLASSNCFLVPSPMLWYELEGTAAYRPVRFQYIIEYM